MRKLSYFALLLLLFNACKKDETNQQASCPKPFTTIRTQVGGQRIVEINVDLASYAYCELEYGPSGFSQGSGTKITTTTITEFPNLPNGVYDFYGRGNCNGDDWSAWSDVTSFLVTDGDTTTPPTCAAPTGLYSYFVTPDSTYKLGWGTVSSAVNYQMEYGGDGFTLGTGTRITQTSTSYTQGQFMAHTTYNFYVRTNCGNGDYSTWEGPKSFYSELNIDTCKAPLNLQADRTGNTISYSFDANGATTGFELYYNINSGSMTGGTTIPLTSANGTFTVAHTSGNVYGIYVRASCPNGDKTPWSAGVGVF